MKKLTVKEQMAYSTIAQLEGKVATLKNVLSSELHRYNQASDTINYQAAQIEKLEERLNKLQADADRYQFLKDHCGEVDYDGGYTLFYRFPQLNRELDDKSLPIDHRYFTNIDACVDHHRNK